MLPSAQRADLLELEGQHRLGSWYSVVETCVQQYFGVFVVMLRDLRRRKRRKMLHMRGMRGMMYLSELSLPFRILRTLPPLSGNDRLYDQAIDGAPR